MALKPYSGPVQGEPARTAKPYTGPVVGVNDSPPASDAFRAIVDTGGAPLMTAAQYLGEKFGLFVEFPSIEANFLDENGRNNFQNK